MSLAKKTVALVVFQCLVFGASLSAVENETQSARKPPWEWRDDERLLERTDPLKAQERVREFQNAKPDHRMKMPIAMKPGDIIDGKSHPELFLPIELFRIFVNGAFASDEEGRAVYREGCETLSTIPLGDNFWTELAIITSPYVQTLKNVRAINQAAVVTSGPERARLEREAEALHRDLCTSLARALTEARQKFGHRAIDRVLYESVAPTAGITTAAPNTAAELRYLAGGCLQSEQ